MGHRRISSQLSEDFRVIDDLTMESLMRSPPRDSGDEVDGYYSKEKKHSIGGQEEDDDDGGENWLYPPTGPEIFCTPPKSVSFPSSRPTTPTRKRSSFPASIAPKPPAFQAKPHSPVSRTVLLHETTQSLMIDKRQTQRIRQSHLQYHLAHDQSALSACQSTSVGLRSGIS